MTASEMEEEQILPTLTTKDDLQELFADYQRHISMLFERTQAKLELIAAQLADISARLPPRA